MSAFVNGAWRFENERIGRPFADEIYKAVFGLAVTVESFSGSEYDKLIGVDVGIRFATGQVLYCQEKFLSYSGLKYNNMTIEYMQNPATGEQGDWFKLGVQLYLAAYLNESNTGFAKWMLIDWGAFVVRTAQQPELLVERQNKRDGARASFKAIKFEDIPARCIIAKSTT